MEFLEEFEHLGIRCGTAVNPAGGLNGYAQLPEVLRGTDFCPYWPEVTYGPAKDGWVGFDTLHGNDAWVGENRNPEQAHLWSWYYNPDTEGKTLWNDLAVRDACREWAYDMYREARRRSSFWFRTLSAIERWCAAKKRAMK